MLVIDPVSDPAVATVHSGLRSGRYTRTATVELGDELYIPAPVDFLLDTGLLLESEAGGGVL